VGIAGSTATLISQIRNETGATLTKGTVVYISGAAGNKAVVSKALATGDSTSAQTYGVIQADILTNQNGYVVVVGAVSGLNTSAFADGTQLYLSGVTAGTYTSTKPYAPTHLVYVGIVTRSHVNQGTIEVKIQNGYEMDELHDVSAQSPTNGDTLVYNSSTGLWTKTAQSTLSVASAAAVPFSGVTSKPTTLSGYGITDAYSSSNPSGYITSSALTPYLALAGGTLSGTLTIGAAGNTRGVYNANGDFFSFYSTEAAARIQMGRDVGSGGGAGLALGGTTYALIGTSDTNGSTLYVKLSTTTGAVSTSPSFSFLSSGFYVGANLALHAGNYNSYALPLTGGTLSGLLTINGGSLDTTYTSSQIRFADGSVQAMKTVAGGVFEAFRAMNLSTTAGTTVRVLGAATSDPFNNGNGGKVFIDAVRTATNMDLVFSLNDAGGAAPVERFRFYGSGNFNAVGAITQNGSQVLTAGNYNSYAPTLTGTGASGSWGINVTGTALNITAYTINQNLGVGNQVQFDSILTTNNGNGTNIRIGDDVWLGDANISYTTRLTGVGDATQGYIIFGNSNNTALGRSGTGALTYGGNAILHAGNYISYAPTLTGTGASGTWGISVTGSSASTTGNAATATALQTARTINGVSFNGTANITVADSTKLPLTGGSLTGALGVGDTTTVSITDQTNYSSPLIIQRSSNAGKGAVVLRGSDNIGTAIEFGRSDAASHWGTYLEFLVHDNNATGLTTGLTRKLRIDATTVTSLVNLQLGGNTLQFDQSGTRSWNMFAAGGGLRTTSGDGAGFLDVTMSGGIRSPIFYDSNDTARYVDPTGTSTFVGLTVTNTITGSVSGSSGSTTGNAATVTNATFYRQFTVRDDRSDGSNYNLSARPTGLYSMEANGTNGPGTSYLSLIHVANGTDVAFQIAGGYVHDAMYFRGTSALQNGTGYSAWRTVLHNGNYNSYAPTLTGTGASGTWGISITGNAATATTATNQSGGTISSTGLTLLGGQLYVSPTNINTLNSGYAGGTDMWLNYRGQADGFTQFRNLQIGDGKGTELFAVSGSGGFITATNSFRAPIFYDSNDTSYYGDFANISITNRMGANYFQYNGAVSTDNTFGLYFENGLSSAYAIYRQGGAWSGTYPDLRIAFHTGIQIGANPSYGGVRFYTDYDMSSQIMSVGNGADALGGGNVFVNASLQANSSLRAPIFYDSNDTGRYVDPASTSSLVGLTVTNVISGNVSGYATQLGGYAGQTEYTVLDGSGNGPVIKVRYDGATSNRYIDIGSKDGFGTFSSGLKVFNGDTLTMNGSTVLRASNYNSYALPLTGGTLSGALALNDSKLYLRTNGDANHYLWNAADDWEELVAYSGTGFRVASSTGTSLMTFTTGAVNSGVALQQGGNQVLHAGNYNSYSPTLTGTGASGTWGIAITGNAGNTSSISNAVGGSYSWTSQNYFVSNRNTTSDSPMLQAYSNNGGGAIMSFHRGGYYAVNFGLDSDNVIRIGGWSASANRLQMDMSGNLTMAGNVTAYSDERLKKDWGALPVDYIERLAQIKSGTYTRIDTEERQAGVSAQDFQKLLPETVLTDNDGMLSVNYGGAALASAVELAKRVVDQEKRIAQLESLIHKLIGD
jgi:hypothetical protein